MAVSPELRNVLEILSLFRGGKRASANQAKRSAQQWLPVLDIHGGLIHRGDGAVAGGLRVEPVNFGLQSEREQGRTITALHEVLNGLREPIQIISLPRPIDLDAYLLALDAKLRDLPEHRQPLLRQYRRYVEGLVRGGSAVERRFYVLVARSGKQARDELRQQITELAEGLSRAGLQPLPLTDQDLADMLDAWAHPAQAAFERVQAGGFVAAPMLEV